MSDLETDLNNSREFAKRLRDINTAIRDENVKNRRSIKRLRKANRLKTVIILVLSVAVLMFSMK